MTVNRYLPFALIYFFINSLALPFGLTYMALLAPLFYVWILVVRKREIILPFIAVMIPFIVIQVLAGVDEKSYGMSMVNLLLVYIFCQAFYTFLKQCSDPEIIFRRILVLNFIFCLIAIVLYFTPWIDILWMDQNISEGISHFRRLKFFTYEPSFYAFLLVPVFFFYFLQYLFRQNTIPSGLLLAMLFLPYILSFSLGVIGSVFVAGLLTWLLYLRRLTKKPRVLNGIINTGAIAMSSIIILFMFFRNNAFFSRIGNIFQGQDTSGKGRTVDAFILADKIIHTGNEYWGVGMGQIKIVGENIIRDYYLYFRDFTAVVPNSAAETLAIFGWVGFSLRLFIEVFFFFYTKVWSNYYRLLLFFFMFIYQFTGSFITNVAEYVIWILAFTNVFAQFNVNAVVTRTKKQDSRNK